MQELFDFTPQPPDKLAGVNMMKQLVLKMKSLATLRGGSAKPSDIVDGELWAKKRPDGKFEFYVWQEKDGAGDGTLFQDFFKVTEISEEPSDNVFLTEKAVAELFAGVNIEVAKKFDKTSVSSALDSESEETALSSKAGKELNDKIAGLSGTVELKSTRSTTGKWVITGLAVGKPVFCLTNMERPGNVGRMRVLEGANKGGVVTGATPEQVNAGFTFGDAGLGASSECFIFIPTEETVTVEISFNAAAMTVYAYQ